MLKVKSYGNGGSTVKSTGYNVNRGPDVINTTSGLFQGMKDAGDQMEAAELRYLDRLEKERKRVASAAKASAAKSRRLQAEQALQANTIARNDSIYGEGGLARLQGQDLVNRSNALIVEAEKQNAETLKSISDPKMRERVKRKLDARLVKDRMTYQKFAIQGVEQVDKATASTGLELAGERVSMNIGNDQEIGAGMIELKANLRVQSPGLRDADYSEMANNLRSKALVEGIGLIAQASPARAAAAMDAYKEKGWIEPEELKKIKTKVTSKQNDQTAHAHLMDITRAHPDSVTEQLATAKEKISDAAVYEKTVAKIKKNAAAIKAAEAEDSRKTLERWSTMHFKGEDVALNEDLLAQLTVADQKKAKKLYLEGVAGKKYQTDWSEWTKLMELSSAQLANPKFNPIQYRDKLDDTKYSALVKAWQKANAGDDFEFTHLRTVAATMKNSVKPLSSDQQEEAYEFMQGEVTRWESQNEKKIPDPELLSIIDSYFMKRNQTNYNWVDTTQSRSIAETTINHISDEMYDKIADKLGAMGLNADEAAVLEWYKRLLMKRAGQADKGSR